MLNPGRATHDILSDASMRRSPVEDLNAEGFCALTAQTYQDVEGLENRNNHRWTVVSRRNLITKVENDTQFVGHKTPLAFAVWNGNS